MTLTAPQRPTAQPVLGENKSVGQQVAVYALVGLPFLALVVAVPWAWGWGLAWLDITLFLVFYVVTGHGITIGYHRHFTHGSFTAGTPVRVGLAVAGSLALQGELTQWVADHRRHHAFSDRDGDPHSPWRFGTSVPAVLRGMAHAHLGWLFERTQTNVLRYAPDLHADRRIRRISALFPLWAVISLGLPPVLGGLLTWSWWGALSAFFWAGLVRIALLHHVTWSINSICHTIGQRPFATRDRSANFWPLAILSFGESWHNSHHADPTAARHGVLRGQLDSSARLIRWAEQAGWVSDVRWPTPERITARLNTAQVTG